MNEPELLEALSEAVHDAWCESKRALGVASRRSETGEELMVPYEELSEPARELDLSSVRAVLVAVDQLGYALVRANKREKSVMSDSADWAPVDNCYCGGPEETFYPHRIGTGRYCRVGKTTSRSLRRREVVSDVPAGLGSPHAVARPPGGNVTHE